MAFTPKEAKFKIPKALGACADLLYETKNKRLLLQKEVDALAAQEVLLKQHIIDTLPKSEASGVAGKLARVTVVTKVVPQVQDWDAFYKYVKKNSAFDLLNKALNKAAVEARWENNKTVGGVGSFNAVSVSVNKV